MTAAQLIRSVSIEAIVATRDQTIATIDQARTAYEEACERAKTFDVDLPRIELHALSGSSYNLHTLNPEEVRSHVDARFWRALLEQSSLELVMSTKRAEELRGQLYDERNVPEFTEQNVRATFEDLAGRVDEFFAESVEAMFRALSWDHRTNSPCKLTPRMILRGCYSWGSLSYGAPILDLERILCLLTKRPTPAHGAPGLRAQGIPQDGEWRDVQAPDGGSPLLRVKGHLVGTVHVVVDQTYVDALNRVMAERHPGQLGPPRK